MGSDKGVPIPIIRNGKKVGIKKNKDETTSIKLKMIKGSTYKK